MKKTLLLLTFIMVSVFTYAQDNMYGVRVGLNISNLDFEPNPTFDNTHRNGFAIGFFGEYDLSKSFAIAPEIQFSAEGAKDKDLRIDYIQIPVLFKYRIGENFLIGAGPMAGVKVWEFEDASANFAFSMVGGIEFFITNDIFIDARYHYGFTNVMDKDSSFEAKNSNIQIGVGVKI
ncbi:porin family protein [Xanthomarina sp. F1114]|uniref:porin family protein n=1 Tax=Xanthomarina sp. F1114 TaxID=2996019 RepID=UPI00225DEEC6|nr:porin family protein [Xanthomarina sp. F1114]MCX7547994.1 porin family protein [Xanthomarina sp. F1114]